jgi:hypothetical protein
LEVSHYDISTTADLVEPLLSLQCDRTDFYKPLPCICHWEGLMTYREQLHPWCIVRHTAEAEQSVSPPEQLVVARFRRRNNAEDHLRRMQRLSPDCSYSIIFDPTTRRTGLASGTSTPGSNLPMQNAMAGQSLAEPGLT